MSVIGVRCGHLTLPYTLNPQGEQEREVMRVLMHCLLAEGGWNPYYVHLAMKLARSSKSHRMTLQVSQWETGRGRR